VLAQTLTVRCDPILVAAGEQVATVALHCLF
jgi:hypothetical protein